MRIYREEFSDIHTDRQVQNRCFALEAIRILGQISSSDQLPPATWLVDWAGHGQGRQSAIKWGILEQLGRMSLGGFSDDQIREVADDIEQWKPKAKIGAAHLRELRRLALPVPRNRRLLPSSLKTGVPTPTFCGQL
jgi:hypothetical protein